MCFLPSPFCVYISTFAEKHHNINKNSPYFFQQTLILTLSFPPFHLVITSQQYSYIMARSCAFLLIFLVFLVSFATPMEGRKVLISKKEMSKMQVPPLYWSLVLSALPKATVPYSVPSKKGHATFDNEKLFVRHLASIDRILRSVPSPGAGH